VLGYQGEQLVACSRVLLLENGNASFGRIAVKQTLRKEGLGKELVAKTMVFIAEQDDFKNKTLQISAQEYLVRFYQGFGFQQQGDSYLEDGIPHVCMTI
jgi:ElaA protein